MQEPKLDSEGYLVNLADWTPEVAAWLAQREAIDLTSAHWEIIHLLKGFYARCQKIPSNRILVKWIRQQCGTEKGNSIYLLQLFPGDPVKLASRIAGLPRPVDCI